MRELRKIGEILDHITRLRDAYSDVAGQFIDGKYPELVPNPLAVERRVYERLDILLTEGTAERMQRLA